MKKTVSSSSLVSLPNVHLVAATRRLVLEERRITAEILAHINEVARRRLYADLGFPSLFEWLRTGEKVSSVEKHKILCSIESSSSRAAEEVLAVRFPESAGRDVLEKVRSVGDEVIRVEVTMTKAQFRKIERARELTSHSKFGASMADIVEVLVDDFLKRRDPLVKEPRVTSQGETALGETVLGETVSRSETAAEAMRVKSKRAPIKKAFRDEVVRRAKGACEFHVEAAEGAISRKCGSRNQVEVDHILPVALGGVNELGNLRLLCRTHNLFEAERLLGRKHMQTFRR